MKERVRTALVEPPRMLTIAIAFRNEFRVRMSLCGSSFHCRVYYTNLITGQAYRGLISRSSSFLRNTAALLHSLSFSLSKNFSTGESQTQKLHVIYCTHHRKLPECWRSTARKGRALPEQSSWYSHCRTDELRIPSDEN